MKQEDLRNSNALVHPTSIDIQMAVETLVPSVSKVTFLSDEQSVITDLDTLRSLSLKNRNEIMPIRSILERFYELLQLIPKFPFLVEKFRITAHAAICREILELSKVYDYCCHEFGVYEHLFEGIRLDGICIDFTLRSPIIVKDFYHLIDIVIFLEDKMKVFNGKLIFDYQI